MVLVDQTGGAGQGGFDDFANVQFAFDDRADAQIRISFLQDGSWSYIGKDALQIPAKDPTMNYGWLKADTEDEEYSRVVLHEFGHSLGAIHEHQSPGVTIPWDKTQSVVKIVSYK